MAPLSEVLSMLYGQAFGRTHVPNMDLTGKIIIVTGANTGLGLECAKHLARKKASRIILACRDVAKGKAAIEKIYASTRCTNDTNVEVWPLDLAKYDSVLAFAQRVCSDLPRLDALIANAGMELQEYRTAENLEIHLTVNVVSMFLCAIAVLPKLRETSAKFDVDTKLTFCGSMYHIFGPDAEFDAGMADGVDMFDALSIPDPKRNDMIWRYALSKLMDHQCVHGLAKALQASKTHDNSRVIVNVVNPGWCGTELSRAKPHTPFESVMFSLMGWTAEKGSRIYLYALAQGKESHGKYISECAYKQESAFVRSARGRAIEGKVWKDLVSRLERINMEVAGNITK